MPTFKLSRRTLLRGSVGGAALGFSLPPLEAMFNSNGTAYAQGAAIPKRLGIFFWGNGVRPNQWVPDGVGDNWAPSVELAPLKMLGVQEYVNVVSGMDILAGSERAHHSGTAGILSGAPVISQPANGAAYRSTFSKPSVDQVAAAVIGTKSRFRSLELGISTRVNSGEGTTIRYLSHNNPDSPNPPEYDAGKVFDRVFGTGFTPPSSMPGMTPIDVTLAYRKSILDAVSGDIDRLKARVGSADKTRLDQHLENVRTIENRLTSNTMMTVNSTSCKLPARPNNFVDQMGREMLEEKTKVMSDLLAIALACDQTKVFSMMFTGSVCSTVFWQANVTAGHHQLTHDERGIQPQVHATTIFTVKMLATMLAALKATPEGSGNVLDNCAILATSDTSDGKFHNMRDFPILIAGKGGGFLRYPGIHYRSPSAENASKALLTLLRAAGTNLNTVGAGKGLVTDSCTAIEA
jgi:hypothetical protein